MGWQGPMTARQWEAWRWWLREQWNKPDRTDHYLMMIAQGINALLAQGAGKEQPQEVKPLEFRWEERPQPAALKPRKPEVEQVVLIDTKTGEEIVHKVPQRLTKEGVQKAEQLFRLFQLSQAHPRNKRR